MSAVSSVDALERIAHVLRSEATFQAIFGMPGGKTIEEQVQQLKREYRRLARFAHPDHAPVGHETLANATFTALKEMWERAEAALRGGRYDQPFTPSSQARARHGVIIQSRAASYQLDVDPYRVGDLSALYRATVIGVGTTVLVKVAADPTYNGWLETEAKIQKRFAGSSGRDGLASVKRFVPELIETFVVSDEERRSFRMNVMPFAEGYVSVTEILEAFSGGMELPDAAWVSRRVIAQAIAAEMAGVIHGAITPDHVLVHPHTHEPLHIGWAHTLGAPGGSLGRITRVIDRWRAWYPPEVFAKKQVSHSTDLYMAGKTLIKLFGGDPERNMLPKAVPSELSRIIMQCVDPVPAGRPQDGKRVLDEFTRVVRTLWGKTYRPLLMPARS